MLQLLTPMSDYHESPSDLTDEIRDGHRALTSLKEEIEAVDWYSQRAACTTDAELRRVIEHNRDEEIEHACLTLEWLRRNRSEWAEAMSTYLFKDGDLLSLEERENHKDSVTSRPTKGLRQLAVGSLKSPRQEMGETK